MIKSKIVCLLSLLTMLCLDCSPGQLKCSTYLDCPCVSCVCDGVKGLPGNAQLCLNNLCPSPEEICQQVCGIVDAGVSYVSYSDICAGN